MGMKMTLKKDTKSVKTFTGLGFSFLDQKEIFLETEKKG